MAYIPKRVLDRFSSAVGKFQKVLQSAKDRDVNEADTVTIIKDILCDLFGFDKYTEVTSEVAIRTTYCDLAVKIDGVVKYLIEVKAIGLDLKDYHLRQALDYGANHGIEWIVLTNGIRWCIHRVLFDRPISHKFICELNLLSVNPKKLEEQEKLFLLCKEGLSKAAIQEFHNHQQVVNRFTIGAIVLSDTVVACIRRELNRVSNGVRCEQGEVERILTTEVIKREVIDGDDAAQAKAKVKRASSKTQTKPPLTKEPDQVAQNGAIDLTPAS